MKSLLSRFLAAVILAGLTLFLSPNVNAGPSPAGGLLIQAYTALDQADHDYKGHRVDAMKQVEAAGKLVGVRVRGDGPGHEKQGISDEQLRTAQNLLEQAKVSLRGKALKHVERAINQISIALRIR